MDSITEIGRPADIVVGLDLSRIVVEHEPDADLSELHTTQGKLLYLRSQLKMAAEHHIDMIKDVVEVREPLETAVAKNKILIDFIELLMHTLELSELSKSHTERMVKAALALIDERL